MILIDNIDYLRKYHRQVLDILHRHEEEKNPGCVEVFESRKGASSLKVNENGRPLYIHSKYDPLSEAQKLVEQYKDVKQYEHIFFYGVGMGYHIEEFLKRYPNMVFSIYEPQVAVLYKYLSHRLLTNLPLPSLKNLYVESPSLDPDKFLSKFAYNLNENVLLVSLPSYERIFAEDYHKFYTSFKYQVQSKKNNVHANATLQKLWTKNSIINLPTTLETPNILHDLDTQLFKDKPVILVAAGPSLDEEIENLRYIKDNGLAYIFSAGSAINALLENSIYPDAACMYDPKQRNKVVFQKVIDNHIDSIPLVYGTSGIYETVQDYPGPKLHMITSKDSVTPYYHDRGHGQSLKTVYDATSIAVVTLQLLGEMQFNPIILVGQNLAYRSSQFFAQGIAYDHRPTELNEKDFENTITLEDVDSNQITSKFMWVKAKEQMELYIKSHFVNTKIFNTTQGGAKIEGSIFKSLEKIIAEYLKTRVVDPKWYSYNQKSYDIESVKLKMGKMEREYEQIEPLFNGVLHILEDIEKSVRYKQLQNMERQFKTFDKAFKRIKQNKFYEVFIKQMNKIQYEYLVKNTSGIKFEKDIIKKTEIVIKEYGRFLRQCKETLPMASEHLYSAHESIRSQLDCEILGELN